MKDPKPGDVIKMGRCEIVVTRASKGHVWYDLKATMPMRMSLEEWRKMMRQHDLGEAK